MSPEELGQVIGTIIGIIIIVVIAKIIIKIFSAIVNGLVDLFFMPFRWLKRKLFKKNDTEIYNVNIVNKEEGE